MQGIWLPTRIVYTTIAAPAGSHRNPQPVGHQSRHCGTGSTPAFDVLSYTPEPFARACIVGIARGLWWSLNGRIRRLTAAEAACFLPPELRQDYLTPEGSENLILPSPAFTAAQAEVSLAAGTDDATGVTIGR